MSRPGWDDYFLGIAAAVATRADCSRRQVGAVIVKDRRIVATGYNGGPSGGPSCLAGQCPRGRQSADQVAPGSSYDTGAGACIALHAEQNAILWSSRADREGGTIYVTCPPCDGCARLIAGSGLARVVYPNLDDRWFPPMGYDVTPVPPRVLGVPTPPPVVPEPEPEFDPSRVVLESGQVLVNVHPASSCEGQPCSIHHPSNHSMRDFPRYYREDTGLMERTCPHGIGHPDPDAVAFRAAAHGEDFWDVHGCDGCCRG